MLLVASLVVVLAGVLTAAVVINRSGGHQAGAAQTSPGLTAPEWTTVTNPTSAAPATTSTSTSTSSLAAVTYLPLWPFAGRSDAAAWQQAYRSGGAQPWHLDPGQTALSFTQGYLGYTNVDKVVAITPDGPADWVSVGFDNPNGQPVTSAVLHLVTLGTGGDAPWEVVGSRDTTLTLTTPAYGSAVGSPVTVGGLISGVDESLRVQVRSLTAATPLGQTDGTPAGGDRTPWSTTVSFTSASITSAHPGVLTIAVATGGHLAAVERFAITAVTG